MNRILYILLLTMALYSCTGDNPDARLSLIDATAEDKPEQAEMMLAKIERQNLSQENRHYYDLLRIRIDDKLEKSLPYSSDIKEIIDYFSKSDHTEIYAKALYYGGRVAMCNGDAPEAQSNYLEALRQLPNDRSHLKTRSIYASQLGILLIRMRMYGEARHYLSEAIKIDSILNDTVNLARDLDSYVYILNKSGDFDSSEIILKKVLKLSDQNNADFIQQAKIYLAWRYSEQSKIDSALAMIRSIDLYGDPLLTNAALCRAAQVYLQAGFPDTAYMYAKHAVDNDILNNKTTAYSILLSPGLNKYIPSDSLRGYFSRYKALLDSVYNHNDAQSVMMQQSVFNYRQQMEGKLKAENAKNNLLIIVMVCLVIICSATIVIYILKNRYIKQSHQLNKVMAKLALLEEQRDDPVVSVDDISVDDISEEDSQEGIEPADNALGSENEKILATKIDALSQNVKDNDFRQSTYRNELLNLDLSTKVCNEACREFDNSTEYNDLMRLAAEGKAIPPTKPLWDKLAGTISTRCPKFFSDIETLAGCKIKKTDLIYLMLVKFGLKQHQIATLTSNSQQTVNNTRKRLSKLLFGEELDRMRFHHLIRVLSSLS